ncbi:MAG TPA: helix-hairpin-helix domain-containing protein [Candidatus Limnocylindrales bacterium]|nr:helix-hairpin-helix domain-containing protein [Candidatus Limnocylindrales bacterium]
MDSLPSGWPVLDTPAPPTPESERSQVASRGIILAVGGAVIASLVLALAIGVGQGSDERTVIVPSAGASGDATATGAAPIVVEVSGAVQRPGLVRLPAGSRIADAIAAAGGYGPGVDAEAARALHLAQPVADGDQVRVPARGDPTAASGGGRPPSVGPGAPIDLNTATAEQLDTLPGIGPATAAKIITARTERRFASLDDVRDRKVVGAATLDKIKDLVVVR